MASGMFDFRRQGRMVDMTAVVSMPRTGPLASERAGAAVSAEEDDDASLLVDLSADEWTVPGEEDFPLVRQLLPGVKPQLQTRVVRWNAEETRAVRISQSKLDVTGLFAATGSSQVFITTIAALLRSSSGEDVVYFAVRHTHGSPWLRQTSVHKNLLFASALAGLRECPIEVPAEARRMFDSIDRTHYIHIYLERVVPHLKFPNLPPEVSIYWWRAVPDHGVLIFQNWATGRLFLVPCHGKGLVAAAECIQRGAEAAITGLHQTFWEPQTDYIKISAAEDEDLDSQPEDLLEEEEEAALREAMRETSGDTEEEGTTTHHHHPEEPLRTASHFLDAHPYHPDERDGPREDQFRGSAEMPEEEVLQVSRKDGGGESDAELLSRRGSSAAAARPNEGSLEGSSQQHYFAHSPAESEAAQQRDQSFYSQSFRSQSNDAPESTRLRTPAGPKPSGYSTPLLERSTGTSRDWAAQGGYAAAPSQRPAAPPLTLTPPLNSEEAGRAVEEWAEEDQVSPWHTKLIVTAQQKAGLGRRRQVVQFRYSIGVELYDPPTEPASHRPGSGRPPRNLYICLQVHSNEPLSREFRAYPLCMLPLAVRTPLRTEELTSLYLKSLWFLRRLFEYHQTIQLELNFADQQERRQRSLSPAESSIMGAPTTTAAGARLATRRKIGL